MGAPKHFRLKGRGGETFLHRGREYIYVGVGGDNDDVDSEGEENASKVNILVSEASKPIAGSRFLRSP